MNSNTSRILFFIIAFGRFCDAILGVGPNLCPKHSPLTRPAKITQRGLTLKMGYTDPCPLRRNIRLGFPSPPSYKGNPRESTQRTSLFRRTAASPLSGSCDFSSRFHSLPDPPFHFCFVFFLLRSVPPFASVQSHFEGGENINEQRFRQTLCPIPMAMEVLRCSQNKSCALQIGWGGRSPLVEASLVTLKNICFFVSESSCALQLNPPFATLFPDESLITSNCFWDQDNLENPVR